MAKLENEKYYIIKKPEGTWSGGAWAHADIWTTECSKLLWIPDMDKFNGFIAKCVLNYNKNARLDNSGYWYNEDWLIGPFENYSEAYTAKTAVENLVKGRGLDCELIDGYSVGDFLQLDIKCNGVTSTHTVDKVMVFHILCKHFAVEDGKLETKQEREQRVASQEFYNQNEKKVNRWSKPVPWWKKKKTYVPSRKYGSKVDRALEDLDKRLKTLESQEIKKVFTSKNDTPYAIINDDLYKYNGKNWIKLLPTSEMLSTDKLKAELGEIDQKADKDIDNIITNYHDRWSRVEENKKKLRESIGTPTTVQTGDFGLVEPVRVWKRVKPLMYLGLSVPVLYLVYLAVLYCAIFVYN